MKKEHFLMFVAGFVLGLVVCYILMRQHYEQQAVPAPAAATPAGPGAEQPPFDPNQHNNMIAQFIEKAKADPKDYESKIMLGNIFYDKRDFKGAIPWYEDVLALQPTNTDVIVDLGVCYRELGEFQKALERFDQALKVDPVKKQALHNRVVVYMDLKQNDKAREALKAFEKAYPGDPTIQSFKETLSK